MFDWKSKDEWKRVVRYYQAGIANTAFGYGCYAALIALGLNLFLAQAMSHVIGTIFNYVTYSRYAFRDHNASVVRYLGAYAGQYLLSVLSLSLFVEAGLGPYAGGIATILFVSVVNYLVLKIFVYRAGAAR